MKYPSVPVSPCCGIEHACVFSKAILARTAGCELARRQCVEEHEVLACSSPAARDRCGTLAALLHERARTALRLPPPGRPLIHVHALRLQCSGLAALQQLVVSPDADVNRLVAGAQQQHGSLAELPWGPLVAAAASWQPGRRVGRSDQAPQSE